MNAQTVIFLIILGLAIWHLAQVKNGRETPFQALLRLLNDVNLFERLA